MGNIRLVHFLKHVLNIFCKACIVKIKFQGVLRFSQEIRRCDILNLLQHIPFFLKSMSYLYHEKIDINL